MIYSVHEMQCVTLRTSVPEITADGDPKFDQCRYVLILLNQIMLHA